MTKLDYSGNITDDIKLVKDFSDKRQKRFFRFDMIYLGILISYLIFFVGMSLSGNKTPNLSIYVNTLIIYRNLFYIMRLSKKSKADDARWRIDRLFNKIFEEKSEDNNLSLPLDTKDLEDAVIITNEETEEKRDESGIVYNYIETIINYIYFIDKEDRINALREIRKTIMDEELNKEVETVLELLSADELPEVLPVKQVLKLEK